MWKLSAAAVLLSCELTVFGNRFKIPAPLRTASTSQRNQFSFKSTPATVSQKLLFTQRPMSTNSKFDDFFAYRKLLSEIESGKVDLHSRDSNGNTILAAAICDLNLEVFDLVLPKTTDLGLMGHEHFFAKLKKDIIKKARTIDDYSKLSTDDYIEDQLALLGHMKFEYMKRKDCQFD